jgi:hypothetical protein
MTFRDFKTRDKAEEFMDKKDDELAEHFLTLREVGLLWRVEWWEE